MLKPQPDDVEETVRRSLGKVIAVTVATAVVAAMIALWVGCLMASVSSRDKFPSPPCLLIIAIIPSLVASVWAMLGVALCLMKKWRHASRISAIGDPQMPSNGRDDVGEHGMVQPPMQPPQVPIIPSSSSPSEAGVRASANAASAAGRQVGGQSHQQRSEREREVEMSGEAVSDGRGQNA